MGFKSLSGCQIPIMPTSAVTEIFEQYIKLLNKFKWERTAHQVDKKASYQAILIPRNS